MGNKASKTSENTQYTQKTESYLKTALRTVGLVFAIPFLVLGVLFFAMAFLFMGNKSKQIWLERFMANMSK